MDLNMTIFGQMLSFAILIWFTAKFIWPPLMAAIEERQTVGSPGTELEFAL